MYTAAIFGSVALLALGGNVNAYVYENVLAVRQDTGSDAYINSVCLPNITEPVIPPCQEITNIESACLPNGTTPLALLAHAECMCGGSYFADWIGCLNCQFVHGARSPAVTSAFHSIITSASQELCTGTPTQSFQAIFRSLQYDVPQNGSATATSDLFPGKTEVSLYFTPTGTQGPGVITGSATEATRVASTTTTMTMSSGSGTGTGTVMNGANGGKSTSASAGSQSSSTSVSKAGAAPTGVWIGGLGVVAGVVGIVVL